MKEEHHDALMRTIKIVDIISITAIYFLVGYYIARVSDIICDYTFGLDYTSKSNNRLLFEIVFQLSLSAVLSYIGRILIYAIPFPLDGYKGYSHKRVKEFSQSGGILWAAGTLGFERVLRVKIGLLRGLMTDFGVMGIPVSAPCTQPAE